MESLRIIPFSFGKEIKKRKIAQSSVYLKVHLKGLCNGSPVHKCPLSIIFEAANSRDKL